MAGRNSIVLDTYGRAFEGRFRKHLATSDTDLVIDGFGGSGNSFAVLAFDSAQSSRVNVAHHSHMPIQFTRAEFFRVPALWLIRNPLDTASSLLSRDYVPSGNAALRDYVAFYRYMLQYRPSATVADI